MEENKRKTAGKTEKKAEEELSVEESFERLEDILNKMENEETGLEESFRLYEDGIRLVKSIDAGIGRVEERMKIISEEETI